MTLSSTEIGEIVDELASPAEVAMAIDDVRKAFDHHWPPAPAVIPKRVSTVFRWTVESETWWQVRSRVEHACWTFATTAPLRSAADLEVEVEHMIRHNRESSERTVGVIVETRSP